MPNGAAANNKNAYLFRSAPRYHLTWRQAQLAAKSINVTKKLIRVTEGRQNNHRLAIAKHDRINYPELVLLHAQIIPLLA